MIKKNLIKARKSMDFIKKMEYLLSCYPKYSNHEGVMLFGYNGIGMWTKEEVLKIIRLNRIRIRRLLSARVIKK